jgi:predicted metalloprotease with PDZ domain
VYTETPSDYFRTSEVRRQVTDLTYSLGMVLARDGRLTDVLWEGPAYKAGLVAGAQIVAVNGIAFDAERLKAAIRNAKKADAAPTELLVRNGDRYRTVRLDYHGGLRYPRLEREATAPARLDQIFAPRD